MPSPARALAGGVAAVLVAAAAASPVDAQGRGNAFGRGRTASPSASSAPASASSVPPAEAFDVSLPPGTGVRSFGAWLDDASMLPPGTGWASVSFGYWRTPLYREVNVPMIDGGVGVTPRLQVGFSAPVYHVSEPGGPTTRGVGDVYLNAKVQLRDPAASARGIGFALVPVLEVLSFQPHPDEGRVQWALPGTIEVRRRGWRLFGSAGYFSRGSLFAAAGAETALSDSVWLVGTITQSHSIRTDDLSAALGLTQTRTDVSGGATVAVTPGLAVFGSAGRTLSRADLNSTTFFFTTGVSYNFQAWK
jgi:hypothetical protein